MFGKKNAQTDSGQQSQGSAGAVRESRFARELKISVSNIDFGIGQAPHPQHFESIATPEQPMPEQPIPEQDFNDQPQENWAETSADFQAEPAPNDFQPNYQSDFQAEAQPNLQNDFQSVEQPFNDQAQGEWTEAPSGFETFAAPESQPNFQPELQPEYPAPDVTIPEQVESNAYTDHLQGLPFDDQQAAKQFIPPETDFYAETPTAEVPTTDFGSEFDATAAWDTTPQPDFQNPPPLPEQALDFENPVSIDGAINPVEEIPPVSLNPADNSLNQYEFPDATPTPETTTAPMEVLPENSGDFLDNVSDNLYPETPLTEVPLEQISEEAIDEAEEVFEDAGNFLFPEAPSFDAMAPDAPLPEATDNTFDLTPEISPEISPPPMETEFPSTPAPSDPLAASTDPLGGMTPTSGFDPLTNVLNDPLNTPLSADATNVSLDPLASQAATDMSLSPGGSPEINSGNQASQTESPGGEFNPNNLQVIATHPLFDDKSLMLVEGDGQIALMGKVGYDDNEAMVAILKMFDHNPMQANNTFAAQKEASAGDKHMYLTQVGDWQGIVSCDERVIALHTELT